MKKPIIASILLLALFASCTNTCKEKMKPLVEYVNPLVGTLSDFAFSTGNTYPAIAMPWGMNFWTPQTGPMGDGWTYNYYHRKIKGFKQTRQPSPWINDYGAFSLMPTTGYGKWLENERESWFSHMAEVSKPHYYSVYLADHNITTEITPTERAALFRITFPENDESYIIVDAYDRGSYIEVLPDGKTVIGYSSRNSGGVPANFRNYFVMVFDHPIEKHHFYVRDITPDRTTRQPITKDMYSQCDVSTSRESNHVIAALNFKTKGKEQIHVKIASSFISHEQAFQNLKELEIGGEVNFETIKKAGAERWNEVLGRIQVEGGTEEQYRTFYSCLYRVLLFPRKFYEVTAQGDTMHYSPYNGNVYPGILYTDNGFWDTFRSLFPLLNLVYPSVNREIQQGLLNTYLQSGFLPEWASPGHRNCMIGNNSASIVADAIVKGITRPQDIEPLYKAMVHGTKNVHPTVQSTGRFGHEWYNTLGYIPYDVGVHENVARTLEYAYNDWCILQVAELLNRPEEEKDLWRSRSQNYRNVFCSEVNLMRGRNKDGTFQTPFSAYKWGDAFTEGNSWHYSFSVFHDVPGLMELMGGKKAFEERIDSLFLAPPIYDDSYYGYRIHEITEMQVANMGNYAHGNQPAQHIIYLYNYANAPRKTQYWVREVMNRLYNPNPDGYCGDEDNGQTSAWYVFSALGFYPVCPASFEYAIGAPLFRKATIHLENGKKIVINAPNNSAENRYVQRVKVNGKRLTDWFLDHRILAKGARIEFDMTDQ
jgi:predicted alpha-1,2-mannosidase